MRTTLTLTVDDELAQFIADLPGLVDPSALINRLLHEDMARRGIQIDPTLKTRLQNDEELNEAEFMLDENTHAAE